MSYDLQLFDIDPRANLRKCCKRANRNWWPSIETCSKTCSMHNMCCLRYTSAWQKSLRISILYSTGSTPIVVSSNPRAVWHSDFNF